MTVTRIGLEDGLGVMVLVPTGIGVAFTLLLLEWHVLHAENGMLSHVATALEVTTGVPPGTGVAVASPRQPRSRTGPAMPRRRRAA